MKIHQNHFCLFWKSQDVGIKKAIEEKLKANFKIVHKVISVKHGKRFVKNEYKLKKVQSQLTIMVLYDIESFSTMNCVTHYYCEKRLSKF